MAAAAPIADHLTITSPKHMVTLELIIPPNITTAQNANAIPNTKQFTGVMYGQADIQFESEYIAGDANADGGVDIADVTAIINIVLAGDPIIYGSDCNGDGMMNIQDVTCAIDIVLNQ